MEHSKTTPAHPQCNAQVEVFNKTVKKYLASFIDHMMLDWENILPALMLLYITSYHSTIVTTPFELVFGTKPQLPSFPNPDIKRVHYGESTSAESYQLLQKNRFLAKNIANTNQQTIRNNFDKNAMPDSFNIDDLVWYEDFATLGKNPKLTPKWQGPAKITKVNDTNARILLSNGKSKALNVMGIKKFFSAPNDTSSDNKNTNETLDFNSEPKITGPVTRAMKNSWSIKMLRNSLLMCSVIILKTLCNV